MLPFQISAPRWGGVSHVPDTRIPRKYASDKKGFHAGQCSLLQNDAGTEVSYWHKSDATGSDNVLDLTNENPGSAATETGVKCAVEGVVYPDENSPIWAGAPDIILRHFCGVAV